jgi:CheY-like chemotaxis protein
VNPNHNRPVWVMVIEDNPADVKLLRMALDTAQFAYEMTVIADGADALAVFEGMRHDSSTVPDIAVLDLNLPKYDGLEVLEAVRSNPRLAAMPMAVLTSSSSPQEKARIEIFELVTYIRKPSELDQYLSVGPMIRDFLIASRPRATPD